MRFPKILVASAAAVMLASASPAVAAPLSAVNDTPVAAVQEPQTPPVQVDVTTTETRSWYADPMWLAIGAGAVLLIIALAVMASRGRESTTTVVR